MQYVGANDAHHDGMVPRSDFKSSGGHLLSEEECVDSELVSEFSALFDELKSP